MTVDLMFWTLTSVSCTYTSITQTYHALSCTMNSCLFENYFSTKEVDPYADCFSGNWFET